MKTKEIRRTRTTRERDHSVGEKERKREGKKKIRGNRTIRNNDKKEQKERKAILKSRGKSRNENG